MIESADNFADIFRGLPYYLLLVLPVLIICTSHPVLASSEFNAQRMSQFDVNGVPYGCRASALSLEARSIYSWSTSRHCVVVKLQDLTIERYHNIREKAGGLIILLPNNTHDLALDEKENLSMLEQTMLAYATHIPVYFSSYNGAWSEILFDINHKTASAINHNSDSSTYGQSSLLSELFATISANGYQVIISGASHAASKSSRIPIYQGELVPNKYIKHIDNNMDATNKLPVILITAHLNSFGLYNDYPVNADVALLLTLADLFNKIHSTILSSPQFRLMFLLSESGVLLNFQGVKKWLDDNVQLQNVDFVLCLDTVVPAFGNDFENLYMHVSKPPKEGSAVSDFSKILHQVVTQYENVTLETVHKKINLAETQLAWEHERFSMKRLPAFTLSGIKSPKDAVRTTLIRGSEEQMLMNTLQNAKILAESLARYIYNIKEGGDIFAGTLEIKKRLVKTYLDVRSAQHNNDLKNCFEMYLKNVKIIYDKPDVREPDFMFYEGKEASLYIYRVKPAIFDLVLTLLIATYLSSIYLAVQYFPVLYVVMCKISKINTPVNYMYNGNERLKSKNT